MLPSLSPWTHQHLPSPHQQHQRPPHHNKDHTDPASNKEPMDQTKKPRHRHAAFQLQALNELYDTNDHPTLEERTSLAERLGMETKTVNSWFQNKRASSKKRHKGASTAPSMPNAASTASPSTAAKKTNSNSVELPPISALIASVSAPQGLALRAPLQPEFDEYSDEEYLQQLLPAQQQPFYAGSSHHQDALDSPEQSQQQRPKGRSRPSTTQTEELKKVYEVNPHPSKQQREDLGQKIGMRYQSVTNWFQNQRSIAKKRKDEEEALAATVAVHYANQHPPHHPAHHPAASSKGRTFSPFPPAASVAHPSLSLSVPPASRHPSLALPPPPQPALNAPPPRARRSSSVVPVSRGHDIALGLSRSVSRPSSPRVSPYRMPSNRSHSGLSLQERPQRSKRTRPEPYQLDALKKLFRRTPTPSIEERGALALEIGMDVGKVTNWFRNLRQTSRKRGASMKRDDQLEDGEIEAEEQDELMDVDADDVSIATYQSRSATPMHSTGRSSSASSSPLVHAHHPSQAPPPYSLEAREEVPAAPRYRPRHASPAAVRQEPSEESLRQLYTYARAMRDRAPLAHGHSSGSDPDGYADGDSHMGSEEDAQEAVTPSPESSPPPPPLSAPVVFGARKAVDVNMKAAQVKVETGVKVEDALLLLSFSHHAVQ